MITYNDSEFSQEQLDMMLEEQMEYVILCEEAGYAIGEPIREMEDLPF